MSRLTGMLAAADDTRQVAINRSAITLTLMRASRSWGWARSGEASTPPINRIGIATIRGLPRVMSQLRRIARSMLHSPSGQRSIPGSSQILAAG